MGHRLVLGGGVAAVLFGLNASGAAPGAPAVLPLPGTISGVKWLDANRNGLRERGEPGLPGWTIQLTSARTRIARKTTTDAAGNFTFAQLAPGEYTVSEVHQRGWAQTYPNTAAHRITLRNVGIQVDFGNRSCDDAVAQFNQHGLVLPSDADLAIPPVIETDQETTGHVSDLYGAYGDTSTDLWYPAFPCEPSLDDGHEPMPPLPNVDAQAAAAGIPSVANANTTVKSLGPILYGSVAAGQTVPAFGVIYKDRLIPHAPRQLRTTGPYSGRDIIYVHGLLTDSLVEKLTSANVQANATWPLNQAAFVGNGYWKSYARGYWSDHIQRLHSSGGQNRYLIVAWASTQRLNVAVHATLTQIARAMTAGTEVVNTVDPGDTAGFCQSNCVIVSHSAGGLVSDVAMAMAEGTKVSGSALNIQLGSLGFIPDHMKVHVAFQAAFSGSHYGTAAEALARNIVSSDLCVITTGFMNASSRSGATSLSTICGQLASLPESTLADLIPEVAQGLWGPLIRSSPIPVLTIAGGHPSKYEPMKHVFLLGFDDGILTMNSQCANPALSATWPSGYIPRPSPLNVKVFDRGITMGRATRYYLDQVHDKVYGSTSLPLTLAAGACSPFTSPTGMVQPVYSAPPISLARYAGHYSLLQSASDHLVGPIGEYGHGGCNGLDYLTTPFVLTDSTLGNSEEVRVITNPVVYASDPRFASDPMPLVNAGMKTAVTETMRYKRIKISILHRTNPRYLYIWKRYYHLLDGSDCMDEVDYVHTYVVR